MQYWFKSHLLRRFHSPPLLCFMSFGREGERERETSRAARSDLPVCWYLLWVCQRHRASEWASEEEGETDRESKCKTWRKTWWGKKMKETSWPLIRSLIGSWVMLQLQGRKWAAYVSVAFLHFLDVSQALSGGEEKQICLAILYKCE